MSRMLMHTGGSLGEILYCDANGIERPIDVSSLAVGDTIVWDGVAWLPTAFSLTGHWEPVAHGDPADPSLVFSDGDVVMTFVED